MKDIKMETFSRQIKEKNVGINRWVYYICSFAAVVYGCCLFQTCMTVFTKTRVGFHLVELGKSLFGSMLMWVSWMMAIVVGIAHVIPYMKLEGLEGKRSTSMRQVLYYLAFSPSDYVKQIKKNNQEKIMQMGGVIYLISVVILFGLVMSWGKNGHILYLPAAFLVALVYTIFFLLYVRIGMELACYAFQRQFRSGFSDAKNNTMKRKRLQIKNKDAFFCFLCLLIGNLLGDYVLSDIRLSLFPMFSAEDVALRTYYGMGMYGVLLGVSVQFLIKNILTIHREKKDNQEVIGIFCIIILIGCFLFSTNNTFYEDRIEISRMWGKKNYSWEDVVYYRIYKKPFTYEMQLELQFEDSKVKLLLADQDCSERFSAKYITTNEYLEYLYVKNVVEKLDKLGISGEIKDVEKFKKMELQRGTNYVKTIENIQKTVEK